MCARFWTVLAGKESHGDRFGGMTLPTWTSAVARRMLMMTMPQRSPSRPPLEIDSESLLVTPMPMSSRALASLLLNVCVRGLAPSLKCGQGGRTLVGPDIVTMQRVAPHRWICRVMANVETQSRQHLFLAGNRE
jgi:hypothetical protein